MPSLKTTLKIIAVIFTFLSAGLTVSPYFGIDNFLLNAIPKYQNLERAVVRLSSFKYRVAEEYNFSVLSQNDVGFKEFLSIMYNKKSIPYNKKKVIDIRIVKTDAYIWIGDFEATPRYLLGVWINGTFKQISLIYLNDIQTWIQDEKQNDLQKYAFYSLLVAVIIDFSSDFEPKIKEVIMRFIRNVSLN